MIVFDCRLPSLIKDLEMAELNLVQNLIDVHKNLFMLQTWNLLEKLAPIYSRTQFAKINKSRTIIEHQCNNRKKQFRGKSRLIPQDS